ncbi:MAG TPA: GxxExxY protein [Acetobacteraceae bacterium]|nr:GxxExxY protein [Acetobacteraceae bacterium]
MRRARCSRRRRYASCGAVDRSGDRVIGLAIEVHPRVKPGDHTGPGLLESVYELCLCRELADAGITFARQVTIPVLYKGAEVGDGFKADIVVAGELILEIKAVSTILPIHTVQLRTYLRMSGIHVGLLLNFNEPRLVDGLRRYVV